MRGNGPAVAHLLCFMVWRSESDSMREALPHASVVILATLLEVRPDSIILSDDSRIFLGPKTRCVCPIGTNLQVVYVESEGQKAALSIERYQSS